MRLAEVWGIIRGHHGLISFESVVGQGSSFEIHFPWRVPRRPQRRPEAG